MDKKKLKYDLILIISILVAAAVAIAIIFSLRKKDNLVAKINVQNNVVEVIDLTKKEDKDYYIDGLNGKLHIHTHDGAIAVLESNCPHQDCVRMGYVSETNHPIICAYNAVSIVIENGESNPYDAEIG